MCSGDILLLASRKIYLGKGELKKKNREKVATYSLSSLSNYLTKVSSFTV